MDRYNRLKKHAVQRYESSGKHHKSEHRNMSDCESDIATGRSFGGSMRRASAGGLSNVSGAGSAKGKKAVAVDEWDDGGNNNLNSSNGHKNNPTDEWGGGGGDDHSSGNRGSRGGRGGGRYGGGDRNVGGDRNGGDRYGGGDRNGGDRYGGGRGGRGGGGNRYEDRNGNDGERRGGGGGGYRDRNGDDGERRGGGGGGYRDRNGNDGERRGGGGYRDRNGDDGERRGGGGYRDRNGDDGERRTNGRDRNRDVDDENGEPQKPREFYIPPEPTEDEDEMFKSGISSGINFDKYDKIPVKVSGKDAPQQINSFEDGDLRGFVLDNIKKSGYLRPTPIQKTAIPIVMKGRDLMACAQTGSGKTAAFLVPIINQLLIEAPDMSVGKPHAVIISPTRELSLQIYNEARKFAMGSYLKVSIVYGGTSSKHQSEKVSKGCHILICTPGRLLDFVDRDYIRFDDIRFVVLDEADRMLDMGFVEPVRRVMNHETMRSSDQRQTLMFSATFPEEIQRLAGEFLNNYIFVTIGVVGGACSDVEQTIFDVNKREKLPKLLEILNVSADGVIVFVETKRQADFLASMCSESGFPTTSIHGDRLQSQREQALADFKSGKMKVLVATSVAARGLDIKKIAHVVNYDLPSSIDDFVHRIGRTGRVGNDGRATSFFCAETDAALAPELVRILQGAGQEVPDFLLEYARGGSAAFSSRSSNNRFGGRDVRQNNKNEIEGPPALEEDEVWE